MRHYTKWTKELDMKLADLCNNARNRSKSGKVRIRKLLTHFNLPRTTVQSRVYKLRKLGMIKKKLYKSVKRNLTYRVKYRGKKVTIPPYKHEFEACVVAGSILLAGILIGIAILFG